MLTAFSKSDGISPVRRIGMMTRMTDRTPTSPGQSPCDVLRLDVLNTANLCPAISAVDLPYLFTAMISLAVWSIFSCL